MPNKYLKRVVLVVILIGCSIYAQGPPPPPPPLPIDSGIIGLFLVAIGYAVKKIKDNSKN